MAFRIQDPSSKLFWEVDGGYRIRLGANGSVYTHDSATGFIVNVDTGMNINIPGNIVMEGDWPAMWTIENGIISMDSEHIIRYDEDMLSLRVTSESASWVLIPEGGPVAAPEPVEEDEAVPALTEEDEVVPESVEEDEAVAELTEEDEDVPVARYAALIEEALNAKAASPDTDEDEPVPEISQ
jgi:hypothetical protein